MLCYAVLSYVCKHAPGLARRAWLSTWLRIATAIASMRLSGERPRVTRIESSEYIGYMLCR